MKHYLLLGADVSHSMSPALYSDAFDQLQVKATYEARSISANELAGYVSELRAGRWGGINITAPFKFAASELCDREDGPVVNALWRGADGAVCGANTDIAGIASMVRAYVHHAPDAGTQRGKAYVLGAGATALSAVEALRAAGFVRVVVVARDVARAEAAVDRIGGAAVAAWGSCSDAGAAVVVQASSAPGAEPLGALSWAADELAKPVVLDVRYGAAAAPFAEQLRATGYVVHHGERMLVVQAAEALRLFLGVDIGAGVDIDGMGRAAFGESAWRAIRSG